MIKVAIVGGSGYTGVELTRILHKHPHVEITSITSERNANQRVSDVFPHLRNISLKYESMNIESILGKADLFFLCLPHKTSQDVVARLHNAGKRIIDLSADYRLKKASIYTKWYDTEHHYTHLLKKAVYGLPEIWRERIRRASIVANPGCYPVSAILGLAPIIGEEFIDHESIVIDSKSGTSGAGRSPAQPFMYCEVNESVKAYSVTRHRHTPEIEQELSLISGRKINVTFTPHLMPMDRGILSTIYVTCKKRVTLSTIVERYREYYSNEPFVRVLPEGVHPVTKAVKGTNFCDISVFLDTHAGSRRLIIISTIDNLIKGASGNAVQNMNIMFGFDETEGLRDISVFP